MSDSPFKHHDLAYTVQVASTPKQLAVIVAFPVVQTPVTIPLSDTVHTSGAELDQTTGVTEPSGRMG